MKHYRIYLAVAILVLASLACQAVQGGPKDVPATLSPTSDTGPATQEPVTQEPAEQEPTSPASSDSTDAGAADTDFPMTDDASNIIEANGTLIFYTKMSQEDLMAFYRNEYKAKGYTEREILTVVSDGVFSMVFDGDPSGKAVVIQSVDMGDNRTITIRLEDV